MHSEHLRNSDWQREIQYILRSIKSNQITSESKYRLHSVSFMYVVFFCCCSVSHEYPQNRKTKCKRARPCTKQSVAIHWCACAVCFSLHQILLALFLSLNFSSVPLFVMKAILFFLCQGPKIDWLGDNFVDVVQIEKQQDKTRKLRFSFIIFFHQLPFLWFAFVVKCQP